MSESLFLDVCVAKLSKQQLKVMRKADVVHPAQTIFKNVSTAFIANEFRKTSRFLLCFTNLIDHRKFHFVLFLRTNQSRAGKEDVNYYKKNLQTRIVSIIH